VEAMAAPHGSVRAGPGSQNPSHCLSQEPAAGGHWGSPSPRHQVLPWERAKARMWVRGWAWLSEAHGQAGQGSGELENSHWGRG